MYSLFKNRFGVPGVIAVIALVFAMIGGAYAASGGGSEGNAAASAVKKGPRGPRGPRGPQGPAGPQGSQGPVGPAGAPGLKGAAGATGPTGATGAKGLNGSAGPKGATGATGAPGAEGSPWTAGGTLPSGATEVGMWVTPPVTEEGIVFVPLGVSIPLGEPVPNKIENLHYLLPGEENPNCPGTPTDPKAKTGHLCVYAEESENAEKLGILSIHAGGLIAMSVAAGGRARGTFALSAP
jgi:Collagen triple helix repeat (20 copies)